MDNSEGACGIFLEILADVADKFFELAHRFTHLVVDGISRP